MNKSRNGSLTFLSVTVEFFIIAAAVEMITNSIVKIIVLDSGKKLC